MREACNAKGSKISGIVEIDETYIGGLKKTNIPTKRPSIIKVEAPKQRQQ